MRQTGITTHILRFFFCISEFINFNTASKSSGKKFDTTPVGSTI